MSALAYPRLIKRVRAVLIDSVLVPISVFATLIAGDALGVSHPFGKVMLLLMPVFVLEPGLVSLTGGTVGHHLMRIRVTTIDGARKINIFAATIRFVVKILLGWASFIFVLTTAKHQALHDLVARSVVIHTDTAGLPAYDVLIERRLEDPIYLYPPAWRRVSVVFLYAIAVTMLFSVLLLLVSSAECVEMHRCTTSDKLVEIAISVCWIVGLGWIVVRGWSGTLFGCRRRKREQET